MHEPVQVSIVKTGYALKRRLAPTNRKDVVGMGTPNATALARTQRTYEAYVFGGEFTPPKAPAGYDHAMASLKQIHGLFYGDRERFRGFVPLEQVFSRGFIMLERDLIESELGRLDARVVEILTKGYFGFVQEGANSCTRLHLLLSYNGKWIAVTGDEERLDIVETIDELSALLYGDLAQYGVLRHCFDLEIDLDRIAWHLYGKMRESAQVRERELSRTKDDLREIREARKRMGLSKLD